MDTEDRFEEACRLMNTILTQRGEHRIVLDLEEDEVDALISALKYYRDALDPSSGDVLIRIEYSCPECSSNEEFRAQDTQVSMAEVHS